MGVVARAVWGVGCGVVVVARCGHGVGTVSGVVLDTPGGMCFRGMFGGVHCVWPFLAEISRCAVVGGSF